MKALVVLSGGQDSTTCLGVAISRFGRNNVHAITFDYGQRHRSEVESARTIAKLAGIAGHEVIEVPAILKGSSPLVNTLAAVETYASAEVLPGGLEKTFVPMRNQLFLTIAANRAVVLGEAFVPAAEDVAVFTGVSQEDYGGYPDCRESYIIALGDAIDESLDAAGLPRVSIITPLIHLNKAKTVQLSEGLPGVRELLAYSHTCYKGMVPPCGECHACLLRAKGYAEAGVTDPLLERLNGRGDFSPMRIKELMDKLDGQVRP